MRVKGMVKAWATYSNSFDVLQDKVQRGDVEDACGSMQYTNQDMSTNTNWVEVGIATITVEFFPREAIVSKQIEGLREQLRQHRINAEQAEQAILSQISKLTAITA